MKAFLFNWFKVRKPCRSWVAGLTLAALVCALLTAASGPAWARGKPGGGSGNPPPATPPARAWHGFASDGKTLASASRLYLFGGSTHAPSYTALNDLWYYQVSTSKWTLAPTGKTRPPGLWHMGWACGAGRCAAFGGSNGVSLTRDTWVYTESSGAWTKLRCRGTACPSARQGPAFAWDPDHGEFVMFGGSEDYLDTALADTWTFDGQAWVSRDGPAIPPGREAGAMAHVPQRGVILFGGLDQRRGLVCDMYAWNGTAWSEVLQSGGPCLFRHSMAWEPGVAGAPGRLIVAGGSRNLDGAANADTWYFTFGTGNTGSWQKGPAPACSSDTIHAGARMARDPPSGKKVFFGGEEISGSVVIAYGNTVVCD